MSIFFYVFGVSMPVAVNAGKASQVRFKMGRKSGKFIVNKSVHVHNKSKEQFFYESQGVGSFIFDNEEIFKTFIKKNAWWLSSSFFYWKVCVLCHKKPLLFNG